MDDPIGLAPGIDEIAPIVVAPFARRRFCRVKLLFEKATRCAEFQVVVFDGRENSLMKSKPFPSVCFLLDNSCLLHVGFQELQFLP